MLVGTDQRFGANGQSFESVQVELLLEGSELCLCEEDWHDLFDEHFLVMHLEGSPIGVPRDDVIVSILFGFG